tara:strand:+ start:15448 stop:16080 length:633 start_codon:yes stop_codon:yes gene_type:complete
MSRVILPRGFEPGDVINPDYVNDNFEALAEAANGLGPSNIQARSIPQSALESQMALGQIVVPLGHEYVDLAIDNGAAGDGAENMVVLSPPGDYWAFAGKFPIDITIVNVSWCFREYSGGVHGYILVNDQPHVEQDAALFSTFIPSPAIPIHNWTIDSPRWVDRRATNLGWSTDRDIWVAVNFLTAVDVALTNHLYESMSITLTYQYELFS